MLDTTETKRHQALNISGQQHEWHQTGIHSTHRNCKKWLPYAEKTFQVQFLDRIADHFVPNKAKSSYENNAVKESANIVC